MTCERLFMNIPEPPFLRRYSYRLGKLSERMRFVTDILQKKIDGLFKFKHIDKIIEVNPSLLTPPFVGEPFNGLVKRLSVEFNDPSLSDNAIQLLSTHLMFIYPEDIPYSEDEIIEALYQVSSTYLQSKKEELKDRCFEKGIDAERVQQLIDDINFSLNNF